MEGKGEAREGGGGGSEGPRFETSGDVPAKVRAILSHDLASCDPKLQELLELLSRHGADECWHKHGTFKDHLFGTWRILHLWDQPEHVARCGLYHSAYSNSYVNLAIFKPDVGRGVVRDAVGDDAEALIHFFCTIPRQELIFDHLLPLFPDKHIPKEGVEVRHIRNADEKIRVPLETMKISLILTIADFVDQLYGWQDSLFLNDGSMDYKGSNPTTLWPGSGKPGLWVSCMSQMAAVAHACQEVIKANGGELGAPLPPIFNGCTRTLTKENEKRARDLYWNVVMCKTEQEDHAEAERDLLEVISLNPFVAEPRVLLAQICNCARPGRFEEAEAHAKAALELQCEWGTAWDKRMPWEGWIAWTRIQLLQARRRTWPDKAWGVISFGLV